MSRRCTCGAELADMRAIMGTAVRIGSLLIVLAGVLCVSPAVAQRPVCPAPAPDDVYYTACANGIIPVSRFLSEFSADQLFKARNYLFTRRAIDIVRTFDAGWVVPNDHPLVPYLVRLKPIEFMRLDTTTGTVEWKLDDPDRNFSTRVEISDKQYELAWKLPARVSGGYWRTPGVVQIAFWETQRPAVTFQSPEGLQLHAEVSCLTLSADGLRVVTTDAATPDILVQIAPCQ